MKRENIAEKLRSNASKKCRAPPTGPTALIDFFIKKKSIPYVTRKIITFAEASVDSKGSVG
jgi:hypothetical protein